MSLERLWYESSPYLYVAGGMATAADAANLLMKASGLVLLAAALTILGLRWIYRHDDARSQQRFDDSRMVKVVTDDLFYEGPADDSPRSDAFERPPARRP